MSALHVTIPLLRHGPLAVAYQQLRHLKEFHVPLIAACGGIEMDLAKLEAWKNHFEL